MCRHRKNQTISPARCGGRKCLLAFTMFLLMAYAQPMAAQQQPDKIQRSINALKKAYYCEDADYHTDGQRIVWVKSYNRWTPDDFETIKKEEPSLLKFLRQAVAHNRLDVLEQILPDYYRYRGGAKAFAEDIKKVR